MPKAIRIHETGGPDVMHWEDVSVGETGPGEVRVRHTAIGVNFIDVYYRTGLYKGPSLPFTPGMEAAGVVESVGAGVTHLKAGDRCVTASTIGAYCEVRVIPAEKVVRLPDGVDDRTAAALMLKGMTAHYLLFQTRSLQPGETILFHAAAGGTGSIACQWAKNKGATVIGTVGSEAKIQQARDNGCDHVLLLGRDDIAKRVRELTGGRGVPVVYDGVGKDTFMTSLDCLAPRGLMVLFGQSSGSVPPFDPGLLAGKGSLYLTRPTLMTYTATAAELQRTASATLDALKTGAFTIRIGQTFPLSDASAAHRALEGRHTTGATVLTV